MPMASTTIAGHVARAVEFYNTSDIYFGIGKTTSWDSNSTPTSSPLNDDQNPPEPTSTDVLQEIVGYKRVDSKFLVYPDNEGEISCNGRKWKIVTNPDDAQSLGARWIYLASWLLYNELPTDISYRQVGVVTGLVKSESVAAGKTALLPEEVSDAGILQAIYHRKPVYRDANQREQLMTIITF